MKSLNTIIEGMYADSIHEGMFDVEAAADNASRELEVTKYITPLYTTSKISMSVNGNVVDVKAGAFGNIRIKSEGLKQIGIDTIISDSGVEYYEQKPLSDLNIKGTSFTYYDRGGNLVKLQNMHISGDVYFSLYRGNDIEFKNVTIDDCSTIKFDSPRKLKFDKCNFKSNELAFENISQWSELGGDVLKFIEEWEANTDDPETIQHIYSKSGYSINNIMSVPKNWNVDTITFVTINMPRRAALYFMTKKAWSAKPAYVRNACVLMDDGWYVYYGLI